MNGVRRLAQVKGERVCTQKVRLTLGQTDSAVARSNGPFIVEVRMETQLLYPPLAIELPRKTFWQRIQTKAMCQEGSHRTGRGTRRPVCISKSRRAWDIQHTRQLNLWRAHSSLHLHIALRVSRRRCAVCPCFRRT